MSKKAQLLEQRKSDVKNWLAQQQVAYRLKTLEDVLPKELGIPSLQVKEVVEALANDSAITKSKVGNATYYWLFPADKGNESITKIRHNITKLQSARVHRDNSKQEYEKALKGKEDTEERRNLLQQLEQVEKELAELEGEEEKYADNDPELIINLERNIDECINHANRWTDSIHTIIAFYRNRGTDFTTGQLLKHVGLPEELDDIPPRVPKQSSTTLRTSFGTPVVRKRPS